MYGGASAGQAFARCMFAGHFHSSLLTRHVLMNGDAEEVLMEQAKS